MYILYQVKRTVLNKKQGIVLAITVLLFGVLYFGLDTKPSEQKLLEKSRSANFESTGIQLIFNDAKAALKKEQLNAIEAGEVQLKNASVDSLQEKAKIELSQLWFRSGHPAIAGFYAEEIAEVKNDEDSWAIAGTTYLYGVQSYKEEKLKDFCAKRSRKALEKASSLNPENVDHKINLALGYVEFPPKDNPMAGVLQLVGLNKKYPENVKVLNQLGRLAIRTNQIDKAIERLSSAEALDKNNKTTICLLAEAYSMKENETLFTEYTVRCKELIK